MDDKIIIKMLAPYNPWWIDKKGSWREDIPSFKRDIVERILSEY